MAQTLQKMIFNDQNNFTHVLVALTTNFNTQILFSGVSTILDQDGQD